MAEKLWVGVITETLTRVVAVQANTREEAAYQLDNGLVKHELQEYTEERSRRITCELTRTRKKRTKTLESLDKKTRETTAMRMTKKQAVTFLLERGAQQMIAEDRLGETKRGWWLDGGFLATDPLLAVQILLG